jgi:hypothetical protein
MLKDRTIKLLKNNFEEYNYLECHLGNPRLIE